MSATDLTNRLLPPLASHWERLEQRVRAEGASDAELDCYRAMFFYGADVVARRFMQATTTDAITPEQLTTWINDALDACEKVHAHSRALVASSRQAPDPSAKH